MTIKRDISRVLLGGRDLALRDIGRFIRQNYRFSNRFDELIGLLQYQIMVEEEGARILHGDAESYMADEEIHLRYAFEVNVVLLEYQRQQLDVLTGYTQDQFMTAFTDKCRDKEDSSRPSANFFTLEAVLEYTEALQKLCNTGLFTNVYPVELKDLITAFKQLLHRFLVFFSDELIDAIMVKFDVMEENAQNLAAIMRQNGLSRSLQQLYKKRQDMEVLEASLELSEDDLF